MGLGFYSEPLLGEEPVYQDKCYKSIGFKITMLLTLLLCVMVAFIMVLEPITCFCMSLGCLLVLIFTPRTVSISKQNVVIMLGMNFVHTIKTSDIEAVVPYKYWTLQASATYSTSLWFGHRIQLNMKSGRRICFDVEDVEATTNHINEMLG